MLSLQLFLDMRFFDLMNFLSVVNRFYFSISQVAASTINVDTLCSPNANSEALIFWGCKGDWLNL